MSRAAMVSTGVFLVLLLAVVVLREDRISEGMRSLELPHLSTASITGIELAGSHRARLVREGERWTLRDPDAPDRVHPVETRVIERALEALAELEVGAFVTGRADKHAELELGDEQGTFVTISRGDGAPVAVVLGRQSKSGGTMLRLREADEVFEASAGLDAALRIDFDQWRRRELVPFAAEDIEQLRVERPGEVDFEIVGEPDGEGKVKIGSWALASDTPLPTDFRVDPSRVESRVRSFASLRASGFVDDDREAIGRRLSETGVRVAAVTTAGVSMVIRVGALDEAGEGQLQIEGDESIYRVTANVAELLVAGLDGLRDLSLFGGAPDQVRGLRIRHAGGAVSVARDDAAGGWALVDPAEPPAGFEYSPVAADSQVRSLLRLKAGRFVGREGEVEVDGTDPVEIALSFEDGSERILQLGGQMGEGAPQQVFAQPGDGLVYAVAASQKARYRNALELLRKVEPPPPAGAPGGFGGPGGGGGPGGMENLPPELRRQIEEAMRQQGLDPGSVPQ